ncbi:MAG: hypothetical protein EU539_06600 [Promethearchaeota archaeon]|nr:MAG: hypothetical protein EU539_06600 [Candidatus Lokiarchaeota archaeon]
MSRKYTLDRWNWSEKAGKWVFVTKDENGKRIYTYKLEPPKIFIDLTMQIKKVNDKLMNTDDPRENRKLFEKLMQISKKMQNMKYHEG